MATDMFLKIDGIKGESPDSKHKDEIEVHSFSFGAHQVGTGASGGGSGGGKASFSELNVMKSMDVASATLMEKCATGEHIPKAVMTVRKAGGDQREYFIMTLSDIIITSMQVSGADGAGNPSESVSINFAKVETSYQPQKADGTLGGVSKGGWDIKANKKV